MTLPEVVKQAEGTGPVKGGRYFPYTDTVGKLTVGYGRNISDRGFSQDEVDLMLSNDLRDAEEDLHRALPWTVTLVPSLHDALVELSFNLGILRLLDFKRFLAALKAGDRTLAAAELLNSKWASQVGGRAQRLAAVVRG